MVTDDALKGNESDAELVARALEGEARALDSLVDRHHAAVYRVALGILSESDGAEDATQATFLKAVRGLRGFRREASFRTWLLTIAANEARGILRRRSRRRETPLEEAGALPAPGRADPVDRIASREEAERVRALLSGLPEKQRLAVTLRIEEGLSFREVGDVIGSSEGAARVNYHHGIKKLRRLLEESDDGDE